MLGILWYSKINADKYLNIIEENEFPSMKVSTHSNVHVFDSSPLQPTTRVLQSLNPPHTSGSIEPKEINENTVHLLFYLKVKRQINVLQPCQ